MNKRLASILGVLAFSGVLVPWSASQAARADLCAENRPATENSDGSYSRLPILVIIHRKRVDGEEQAQISTICFGKKVYVNGHASEPGDMEFDAKTVTLAFRLGRDLKITRWRHSKGEGDQGGIRMVEEPDGRNTKHPTQPTDWPSCAGRAAAADTDISFDFSQCPRSRYHTYELHVEQCRGNDCKDIPLDPQIVNKPGASGS
jgi:hypothetical protein